MLRKLFAFLALLLGLSVNALATVPAEITTALTDVNDVWDDIKLLIIAVGVFVIIWRFFRKGASKAG